MTNRLKTIKEIAQLFNCSEITIRRLIAARKIPYHKVGFRYLFSEEDISEYLNSVKVKTLLQAGGAPL
jgi:excisionase family DNA binding protein